MRADQEKGLPTAPITLGMSPDSLSADVRAALSTGFVKCGEEPDQYGIYQEALPDECKHGFLGRPRGHER